MLAALALMAQLLVPQGFMPGGAGRPLSVVICTGHGPLAAVLNVGKSRAPAPRAKADPPCGFSGRAAGPAPTTALPALAVLWPPFAAVRPIPVRTAPIGRGLSTPPPARAPPVLLL